MTARVLPLRLPAVYWHARGTDPGTSTYVLTVESWRPRSVLLKHFKPRCVFCSSVTHGHSLVQAMVHCQFRHQTITYCDAELWLFILEEWQLQIWSLFASVQPKIAPLFIISLQRGEEKKSRRNPFHVAKKATWRFKYHRPVVSRPHGQDQVTHEKSDGHRELTVSSRWPRWSRLRGPMITAQSRLGEVTAQSRRGHSSVTARSQLSHSSIKASSVRSRLSHG